MCFSYKFFLYDDYQNMMLRTELSEIPYTTYLSNKLAFEVDELVD